jgi:hypothetical protein
MAIAQEAQESSDGNESSTPELKVRSREFTYSRKKGQLFTRIELAEESGIKKAYLDGITDKTERQAQLDEMYRFLHSQIKFYLRVGIIEVFGVDTFALKPKKGRQKIDREFKKKPRKNGIRGSFPKVYRVIGEEFSLRMAIVFNDKDEGKPDLQVSGKTEGKK